MLYTKYLVPFEVVSVVLLVAMIGAIVFGRRSAALKPGEGGRDMIDATHYVVLSLILFCLGLIGVMMRRNFITVLMSLELMFNAVNLNLIAFSFRLSDLAGQVLAIFVITVAAAEAAIGLGLIIALVRLKDTVALDEADVMRG